MFPLEGRPLMATVTTITSLGFLMIGFDNGLMGGFVNGPQFLSTFGYPDATMIGLFVAIYEVGSFFGAIASSIIGESLGRRKTIGVGSIIMIIGAILQASSFSAGQFIVGRIVSGIGMGFINSTTPVLQAEYSSKAHRGIFVCMQISTLNFGVAMVYWIDFGLSYLPGSEAWRIPTILQCVFLLLQLLLLPMIPDTARWYASHDRADDALMVLRRTLKHRESDETILRLHQDIVSTAAVEASLGSGTWKDILKSDAIKSRQRFLLACAIQIMQQLGGNNVVLYYANTLFESSIGFSPHMAGLMSGYLLTWFFVASFIPYYFIDRVGRRPLLISMLSLQAAVLAVLASMIYVIESGSVWTHTAGIVAAAMLFAYLGAFTVGFEATVWVYPAEILPLRLRQRGSSISTASNWIFNYMVVQITPPAIQNIGWKTYVIFAVFNACWAPIIYFFYPETKGLQLEDVDRLFSKREDLTTLMVNEAEDLSEDPGTKVIVHTHVEDIKV